MSTAATNIPLDFPFEFDGVKIAEVNLRRPKVADTKWAQSLKVSDFERGIKFMARLCDVAPELIEEMDEADAGKVNEVLESFRGRNT